MSAENARPILDKIQTPKDLRQLTDDELKQLADELRQETISAVSVTGGHLGAGLGQGSTSLSRDGDSDVWPGLISDI